MCFVIPREVSEEVDSIKQFSSELIVEAVVRCIRVIQPSLGATLPTSLPPGMSARFRVGMSLAQACQVGGAPSPRRSAAYSLSSWALGFSQTLGDAAGAPTCSRCDRTFLFRTLVIKARSATRRSSTAASQRFVLCSCSWWRSCPENAPRSWTSPPVG